MICDTLKKGAKISMQDFDEYMNTAIMRRRLAVERAMSWEMTMTMIAPSSSATPDSIRGAQLDDARNQGATLD
ncbi:hypothetical protein EVG20_g6628 [Dentipellis fragilis]|uniref:Uncharacterized protein n=1 Tax=Dentipellis fragilis TaxID=205917 RepID=A0A4Y9YNR5_9AGAM|nr:hypothetical protein EVG20_g6628 [Dentipellis fragilis]